MKKQLPEESGQKVCGDVRFGLPQSKQTTEQSLRHNLHATQQTYRSVYDHRERCTLPSENNFQNHRLDELSKFHYIHQPDVRSKQIASKLLEYHENKGQIDKSSARTAASPLLPNKL